MSGQTRRSLMAMLMLCAMARPVAAVEGERLIVLGGDLTEIVFALGAGERVVAVDSTSGYPAEADALPDVGYVRRLAPEGLLSLAPTRVIASHDAAPQSALDKLKAAGVEVLRGPDGEGEAGVIAKIAFIGAALGREEKAEAMAEETRAAFAAARPEMPSGIRAVIVMAGRGGALMAAGSGTSADAILSLAGAENALAGFDGFKPVSAETLIGAAPEAVVVPDHVLDGFGGIEGLRARPEIAATPAGREGHVVVMDTMLLLGFGPRTPQAVRQLSRELDAAR